MYGLVGEGPQLLKQALTSLVLAGGLCRYVLQFGNSTQVGQGLRQGQHWADQ